jgi:hypothetical protein
MTRRQGRLAATISASRRTRPRTGVATTRAAVGFGGAPDLDLPRRRLLRGALQQPLGQVVGRLPRLVGCGEEAEPRHRSNLARMHSPLSAPTGLLPRHGRSGWLVPQRRRDVRAGGCRRAERLSGRRVGQDSRKASRSALIVSASVVGMPCGKPVYVFSVPFCRSSADSGPASA